MTKSATYVFVSLVLCGALTIFIGGCKQQGTAKLTITVEGKELSDANIYIDEKQVGSLTQTVIRPDGKVYINGTFAATVPHQRDGQEIDVYSGCSDSLNLTPERHTITLRKGEVEPLQVIVNISTGHHLLTFLPDRGLMKWDNVTFQVNPRNTVVIASEKGQ